MSWIVDSWRDDSIYEVIEQTWYSDSDYHPGPLNGTYYGHQGPKFGRLKKSNLLVLNYSNDLYIEDTKLADIPCQGGGRSPSDPIVYDDKIYIGYLANGLTPTISRFDASTGSETSLHTGTPSGTTDTDQECNAFVSDTTAYFTICQRFTSASTTDYWTHFTVQEFDLANESGTELYTSTIHTGISTVSVGCDSSDVWVSYSSYGGAVAGYSIEMTGKIDRTTGALTTETPPGGFARCNYGYKGYMLCVDGGGNDASSDYLYIMTNDQTSSWKIEADYYDHWPQVYIIDDSSYPIYAFLCNSGGNHRFVKLNADETITTIKEMTSTFSSQWSRNGPKNEQILKWEPDYIRDFSWAGHGFILPKYEIL
jgi:hypothetical protein